MRRRSLISGLALVALSAGCAARPDPLHETMLAKLRHAEGALDSLVRADYPAIREHALALERISDESLSITQDTVSYVVLAGEFGDKAAALADRAASRDLAGVTDSYVELTRACVNCHMRVTRERERRDFADEVTWRWPTSSDPLADLVTSRASGR